MNYLTNSLTILLPVSHLFIINENGLAHVDNENATQKHRSLLVFLKLSPYDKQVNKIHFAPSKTSDDIQFKTQFDYVSLLTFRDQISIQ